MAVIKALAEAAEKLMWTHRNGSEQRLTGCLIKQLSVLGRERKQTQLEEIIVILPDERVFE